MSTTSFWQVGPMSLSEAQEHDMVHRALGTFRDGDVVNLGIGLPNLIAARAPDAKVYFHCENGTVGLGPRDVSEDADLLLVNAAKKPVHLMPHTSFVNS